MTPLEEAIERANEIARNQFAGMFVTISLGCEYCNSLDVGPQMPNTMTTKELITRIQTQLRTLGYDVVADGLIGPKTLAAISSALDRAKGQPTVAS